MALIARLFDFQPGATIISADLDSEFNQLVNFLNGSLTNKNALIKFSGSDPVLALDQLSSGLIQSWRQSGSDKLKVNNSGQLESLILTGVAPIIVASTTVATNLNADLLDGLHASSFAQIGTNKTAFSLSWFYSVPPPGISDETLQPAFICPEGSTITINKIKILFKGGSHTSGATLTFSIEKRSSTGGSGVSLGTITINNSGPAIFNVLTNNIADFGLSESDYIFPMLTVRSGTITESAITLTVEGKQTFTT